MKIIHSIPEMQQEALEQKKQGKVVGLVPTMGYFHEGHTSLMQIGREQADYLVISLFVNPLQFGPSEDFDTYPRDFERDKKLARKYEADCIFNPSRKDMYPASPLTRVKVHKLDRYLCGRSRPGHFEGVTTIVAKLYNIILPDLAIFGLKDYQQYIIIKQMTEELHYPIKVIAGPTIREEDGLAMSSRNKNLSSEERQAAPLLYRGLQNARQQFLNGEKDVEKLLNTLRDSLHQSPLYRIDYLAVVDGQKLYPKKHAQRGDVIAAAVFLGKTRLIDKIILE